MLKPTDAQILTAVHGHNCASYVIANRLRAGGGRPDTAFVLRGLKRLEAAGKVKRVPSPYAVMICWAAAAATEGKEP